MTVIKHLARALVEELRADPDFQAALLNAAMDDDETEDGRSRVYETVLEHGLTKLNDQGLIRL